MPTNFEFKARSGNNEALEQKLQEYKPHFVGKDLQRDTYFNVPFGRLKLREGNIENALIHYQRIDDAAAKRSDVLLYQHQPDKNLKTILATALGIKVIVEKRRRIWFVDNVKFHFDQVAELGEFVEEEAIDTDDTIGTEKLKELCLTFADFFNIRQADYVAGSYSDLRFILSSKEEKPSTFY